MKVAILGNCQAQAMQAWLSVDAPSVEVVHCQATYLMTPEDREQVLSVYRDVDYIFLQRVNENFQAEYLRPSFMKENFADKYVSWPNIYFDGYFPGIRYLYGDAGKVTGPLSDYHFDFMLEAYKAGRPAAEVAEIVEGEILDLYPNAVRRSLVNLAAREEGLDLRISDYIAQRMGGQQMLYAMNHPVDELLREMLERLLGAVGERRKLEQCTPFAYTLDEIQIPSFPALQRTGNLCPGAFGGQIKGKGLKASRGCLEANMDETVHYDWLGLTEAFYRVYSKSLGQKESGQPGPSRRRRRR